MVGIHLRLVTSTNIHAECTVSTDGWYPLDTWQILDIEENTCRVASIQCTMRILSSPNSSGLFVLGHILKNP